MAVTEKQLTLEEFLALPEEEPALEYHEGRITQKVPPQGKHSMIQFEVAQVVNLFARPKKLAVAFPELRATFAGSSRVPDVAVYRWDRIPVDDAGEVANQFREPPDIAIEIVSPEQSVNGLIRRCLWFIENGTQVALLVDPADHSVLRFQAGRPMAALHGRDRIELDEVLPGFALTVEELFGSLKMA